MEGNIETHHGRRNQISATKCINKLYIFLLSFYIFRMHTLSSDQSVFYTYDETVARKEPNEVCSMRHHYCREVLPANVI
jgi:hypothetical protein